MRGLLVVLVMMMTVGYTLSFLAVNNQPMQAGIRCLADANQCK